MSAYLQPLASLGLQRNIWARLYQAREVALGRSGGVALVPLDEVRALIRREGIALATRYEGLAAKRQSVDRISRRRTWEITSLKRLSGTVGLTAGALAIISQNILPLLPESTAIMSAPGLRGAFVLMAAATGLLYMALSQRVGMLEAELDELSAALADTDFYMSSIQEIVPKDRSGTFWSRLELENFLSQERTSSGGTRLPLRTFLEGFLLRGAIDPKRLILDLQPSDAADLLIKAGQERGLLEEQEELNAEGGFLVRYRVIDPAIRAQGIQSV